MLSSSPTPRLLTAAVLAFLAATPPPRSAEPPKPPPAPAAEQVAPTGLGRVKAKVVASDGKTPVSGATLRAFHLDSNQVFTSAPSGPSGECELAGVTYGYLDLSVDTPEGAFVGNQVVNLAPSGTVAIFLKLTKYGERPPEWWTSHQPREVPGTTTPAKGVAEIRLKSGGRGFWTRPAGIAIIVGGTAAVLLAASSGSSSSSSTVSPSKP